MCTCHTIVPSNRGEYTVVAHVVMAYLSVATRSCLRNRHSSGLGIADGTSSVTWPVSFLSGAPQWELSPEVRGGTRRLSARMPMRMACARKEDEYVDTIEPLHRSDGHSSILARRRYERGAGLYSYGLHSYDLYSYGR